MAQVAAANDTTVSVAVANVAIRRSAPLLVANLENHGAAQRRLAKSQSALLAVIVPPAGPALKVRHVPRGPKAHLALSDQLAAHEQSAQVALVVPSVPLVPSNLP